MTTLPAEGTNDGTQREIAPFSSEPRTRLIFGVNTVEQIGQLALGLPASRVLLVTDPGIVRAGHAERVQRLLEAAGIVVTLFAETEENPSTACVDRAVAVAKAARVDAIIGLGGGSAMDTAKGCNFILTNGGRMQDYWGIGKATKAMLPLIAIPTTSGTGSECQSYAIISDAITHQKMACGDPKAAARIALLDPVLTVSQPRRVTACTGIDALCHALETAVTLKRNPISWMYSREGFQLCAQNLETVLTSPDNVPARGRMLLGAAFAGTAIEHSMLGAVHSAANPLSAHFGIVHGQAVGMMLAVVIRYNAGSAEARNLYAQLAVTAGLVSSDAQEDVAIEQLIHHVSRLLRCAEIPNSLRDAGVDRASLPMMAREAAKQWTAQFNPRPALEADFLRFYSEAFEG